MSIYEYSYKSLSTTGIYYIMDTGMAQKKNRPATQKQITALKLINDGMSPHEAMLKAGYSTKAAQHPKRFLMKAQAIQSLVERFHLELRDEGITTAYLAKKYAQWLDAEDPVISLAGPVKDKETGQLLTKPNYRVQIEAAKMLKDIFNLTPEKKDSENLSRRVTLEEFINT